MPTLSRYVQTIQDAYPELVIHTIRMHSGDGQNNHILIVNDALIFRFPRYGEGVAALTTEIAVLAALQGAVPVAVPDPIYISRNTHTVGHAFMGYRMLPGEPLWHETVAAIRDPVVVRRLATQLADFLGALHTLPIESLLRTVPVRDQLGTWRQMYEDIKQSLFHFMRPDARQKVSRHFETFFNDPHVHPLALRHGDFGTGNILHDPVTHMISGVVDWGAAGGGDPALDIAALSGYGPVFFDHVCSAYGVDAAMLERARFYQGTYALQEALHGIKHNDRDAFESGIAAYA